MSRMGFTRPKCRQTNVSTGWKEAAVRSRLFGMKTADRQDIQSLCDRIVRDFHPTKIILFGSYAGGAPTPDSDVDLLVILPFEGSPVRKAFEIDRGLDHPFPIDLLVRTPEFVERRLNLNDFFYREIVEKGQVLYDAARARVA